MRRSEESMRKTILAIVIISIISIYIPAQFADNSGKKYKIELAAGLSLAKPSQLFYRASAITKLMDHYTAASSLSYNDSGSYKENITAIPINLLVSYPIAENWMLLGGAEFTLGGNSSEKSFSVIDQGDNNEAHTATLTNRINFFMPMAGIARSFSNFSLFTKVGFAFANLKHQQIYHYSINTYWHTIDSTYRVSGTGLALFLGGQYNFTVMETIGLFIRVEFMYLNIGTLTGKLESTATDSGGGNLKESEEGILYTYEINPYGQGSIQYWDIHATIPQGSEYRNAAKLTLNLSSLRITLGFQF